MMSLAKKKNVVPSHGSHTTKKRAITNPHMKMKNFMVLISCLKISEPQATMNNEEIAGTGSWV